MCKHGYPVAWLLVTCQVTLVAESFGGALALRVAAAAPQLLSRLVLVRCVARSAHSALRPQCFYGRRAAIMCCTKCFTVMSCTAFKVV